MSSFQVWISGLLCVLTRQRGMGRRWEGLGFSEVDAPGTPNKMLGACGKTRLSLVGASVLEKKSGRQLHISHNLKWSHRTVQLVRVLGVWSGLTRFPPLWQGRKNHRGSGLGRRLQRRGNYMVRAVLSRHSPGPSLTLVETTSLWFMFPRNWVHLYFLRKAPT